MLAIAKDVASSITKEFIILVKSISTKQLFIRKDTNSVCFTDKIDEKSNSSYANGLKDKPAKCAFE